MSMKILVSLKTDQRLSMNLQLRQAISLLQYSTLELTQLVKQSIDDNPLLEFDDIDQSVKKNQDKQLYSAEVSGPSSSFPKRDDGVLENYAIPISLRSNLLEQSYSSHFDPVQQVIAEAIIDSIDDNGFLTMSLEDIHKTSHELSKFDIEIFFQVLKKIQAFDPCGVAARDLRECLLIQLENYSDQDAIWKIAHEIVMKHLDLIAAHDTKKLIKILHVSSEQFSEAISLIRGLNPNPGRLYADDRHLMAEPELYVEKEKDEWVVSLKESLLTNVKLNTYYQNLIKQHGRQAKFHSLKEQLEEARFLLKGLERRNSALLAVGRYIVQAQKDFFEMGQAGMKPMNIAEVAEALNVHESTVSRITSGKYMATPRGVFELKYFFPSYVMMEEGGQCSAIAVKEKIKQLLESETNGHVLSDLDITRLLKEQGICVARRTVAKYREAMHILPSYLRQKDLELA